MANNELQRFCTYFRFNLRDDRHRMAYSLAEAPCWVTELGLVLAERAVNQQNLTTKS
jgi:hypothetical protein